MSNGKKMNEMNETYGIVLAGGQSRRFGSPKAFARKKGAYFYEITALLLGSLCSKVIIVAREEHLSQFKCIDLTITDEPHILGKGPLAGIYSAMNAFVAHRYIVLPCDMPNLERIVLIKLLENANTHDVTALKVNEKEYPLVSMSSRKMYKPFAQALENNELRVHHFLAKQQTKWIEGSGFVQEPHHVFKNMNRPESCE